MSDGTPKGLNIHEVREREGEISSWTFAYACGSETARTGCVFSSRSLIRSIDPNRERQFFCVSAREDYLLSPRPLVECDVDIDRSVDE